MYGIMQWASGEITIIGKFTKVNDGYRVEEEAFVIKDCNIMSGNRYVGEVLHRKLYPMTEIEFVLIANLIQKYVAKFFEIKIRHVDRIISRNGLLTTKKNEKGE